MENLVGGHQSSIITEDLDVPIVSIQKVKSGAVKGPGPELAADEAKKPLEQRSRSAEDGMKSSVDLTDSSMPGQSSTSRQD